MRLSPRAALLALLALFIALATTFSALTPLGEAADEVSHQSYVRYVAEWGGLPPVEPGTTVFGETFQPPLYYALAAPLTAWLPRAETNLGFAIPVVANPDWVLGHPERARVLLQPAAARWPWRGEALGWHLARLLSVALGAATVAATFRLAGLVFPDEPWTALLAAALVAGLPTFLALSAAVTNDALATTLAALLLWQLAQLLLRPPADGTLWRGWALAGALGGLGVWTKASGWTFVATTLLASWLAARNTASNVQRPMSNLPTFQPSNLQRSTFNVAIAGLAWLLVALPLWALNVQRGGDPLGRAVQAQVTEARVSLTPGELWGVVQGLYRTWWAGFGGAVHLHFPEWLNGLLLVPVAIAGVGLLRRHAQRHTAAPATRDGILLLAGHTLLVAAAWLGWTRLVMGTGQGRLLFPALPAIATLGAGGLVGLFPRRRWREGRVALAWTGVALTLPVAALLLVLLPAYRSPPPAVAAPELVVTQPWRVGETPLRLVALHFPLTVDDRVTPGSHHDFYVEWTTDAPLPDLRLRLRWIDRDGDARWVKEGSPIARHPLTDEWQPGRYAARHRVVIPPDAEPGWYRLMLSVVEPATGAALPLQGPEGGAGTEIMVGQTTVVAPLP